MDEAPDAHGGLARADAIATARAAFAREHSLTSLGMAGLVIAAVCLAGVALRGTFVPPEGKLLDAVTFTFGVAVFTLTMALVLPLTGWSERGKHRWRLAYITFAGYGLVLEPIQAFRGIDPRFSQAGGIVDTVTGITFGATAGLVTVAALVLGVRFFRRGVLADRPVLRNGIRYGMVAVWLSFGVGVAMSINMGRDLGAAGDLMLTHALGSHGIQAVPLIALLLVASPGGVGTDRTLHVAGGAWLLACVAALAQALAGRPPFEASALPMVTLGALVVVVVVGLRALPRSRPVAT